MRTWSAPELLNASPCLTDMINYPPNELAFKDHGVAVADADLPALRLIAIESIDRRSCGLCGGG